jgi:hypothetical protein
VLVEECDFPADSSLDRKMVGTAFFQDSYRAPLCNAHATMADIFFDLFGHNPGWVKALLLMRNRVAAAFGLEVPKASDIQNPIQKASYQVGDVIGPWPIFSLSEHELIAGRDNAHLDFRLSLLRERRGVQSSVVVSTVCDVHNLYGKIYLFFIVPFHKWGVKQMISRAVRAGRL